MPGPEGNLKIIWTYIFILQLRKRIPRGVEGITWYDTWGTQWSWDSTLCHLASSPISPSFVTRLPWLGGLYARPFTLAQKVSTLWNTMPPPGRVACCQPALGELIFQAYSFWHNNLGSMGDVPYREQSCRNCPSLRALTHLFLSLRFFLIFSPMFLEEETRTWSRIQWEEPGDLQSSMGASGNTSQLSHHFGNTQPRVAMEWGCQRGWVMGMYCFKKTCHLEMSIRQKDWTWGWLLTQ